MYCNENHPLFIIRRIPQRTVFTHRLQPKQRNAKQSIDYHRAIRYRTRPQHLSFETTLTCRIKPQTPRISCKVNQYFTAPELGRESPKGWIVLNGLVEYPSSPDSQPAPLHPRLTDVPVPVRQGLHVHSFTVAKTQNGHPTLCKLHSIPGGQTCPDNTETHGS